MTCSTYPCQFFGTSLFCSFFITSSSYSSTHWITTLTLEVEICSFCNSLSVLGITYLNVIYSEKDVEALAEAHDLCVGGDCIAMLQQTSAVIKVIPYVKVVIDLYV